MPFQTIANFIHFARDHRIPIDPKKRIIGIFYTMIGWFLIAVSIVFFKIPLKVVSAEINFAIQFASGTFLLFLIVTAASIRPKI